ncbi:MAG: DUF3990 domain-containing protein [Succinivibrionaceae bacterium]|nr:DUF3990 domain-containing protein [Succinivibrionaceae bacterium]
MILFHGSNQEITNPGLRYSRRNLDFGIGFYTTTDLSQAEKWARRVAKIRNIGKPVVSVFETEQKLWTELSILEFKKADSDWLQLVVNFRTDQKLTCDYDVIAGPVADDRTVDVINQYIAGTYNEEIAMKLLLPMQFKDQWALKTENAVSALVWKETITP